MRVIGGAEGSKRRHAEALRRGQRAVNRLLADVATDLGTGVAALGDRPVRPSDWATLARIVDRSATAIYGRRDGGPSALGGIIERECARLSSIEVEAVATPLERMLSQKDPALLTRMNAEAATPEGGS